MPWDPARFYAAVYSGWRFNQFSSLNGIVVRGPLLDSLVLLALLPEQETGPPPVEL